MIFSTRDPPRFWNRIWIRRDSLVFWAATPTGSKYGYKDGWTEEGVYLYSGEGRVGDMTFTPNNSAIRDHQQQGKMLYLFEATERRGYVKFINQMVCIGYHTAQGPDARKQQRKIIIFVLVPLEELREPLSPADDAIYHKLPSAL